MKTGNDINHLTLVRDNESHIHMLFCKTLMLDVVIEMQSLGNVIVVHFILSVLNW